jgi:hypothetical protein
MAKIYEYISYEGNILKTFQIIPKPSSDFLTYSTQSDNTLCITGYTCGDLFLKQNKTPIKLYH